YVLDGSAYGLVQANTGSSAGAYTLTGPSITPSVNGDLIESFAMDNDGGGIDTWAAGAGFTEADEWYLGGSGANNVGFTEYMFQGTAAPISPTFSCTFTDTNVHL